MPKQGLNQGVKKTKGEWVPKPKAQPPSRATRKVTKEGAAPVPANVPVTGQPHFALTLHEPGNHLEVEGHGFIGGGSLRNDGANNGQLVARMKKQGQGQFDRGKQGPDRI